MLWGKVALGGATMAFFLERLKVLLESREQLNADELLV